MMWLLVGICGVRVAFLATVSFPKYSDSQQTGGADSANGESSNRSVLSLGNESGGLTRFKANGQCSNVADHSPSVAR